MIKLLSSSAPPPYRIASGTPYSIASGIPCGRWFFALALALALPNLLSLFLVTRRHIPKPLALLLSMLSTLMNKVTDAMDAVQ